MKSKNNLIKPLLMLGVLLLLAAMLWWWMRTPELPSGFAVGNGRIEATAIDISTKRAGRIVDILVREGDFVQQGDILVRMDVSELQQQSMEAKAQIAEAESSVVTAESARQQRISEKNAAEAVVKQRQAELAAVDKRWHRTQELVGRGAASKQQRDDDEANAASARSALEAAHAQVMAAQAAIESASSQIVQAKARVAATKATDRRVQTELDDSILKAPRSGRVQYRIAEPGEVLAAGGRVLSMVDLSDVYITFFLPTEQAGKVAIGSEVHIVLDAAPGYVIPAYASYVSAVAQFTPKTVETDNERLKLMFRIKARIFPELLQKYLKQVKTGLPGKAYARLDKQAEWPQELQVNVSADSEAKPGIEQQKGADQEKSQQSENGQ